MRLGSSHGINDLACRRSSCGIVMRRPHQARVAMPVLFSRRRFIQTNLRLSYCFIQTRCNAADSDDLIQSRFISA